MKRQEKQAIVEELKNKFANAKSVVLTDFRSLTVAEDTKLRKGLREAGVDYKVYKNTLVRLAIQGMDLDELNQYLVGPTALAFSEEDVVAPAKVLNEYAKEYKNLKIKGGVIEGKVVDYDGVKALADLPPREVLLAQLLAGMQSPIVGLVNVLQGNIRNLVYVLDAIRNQKQAQA
ncbi:MAG TPA: 50S ribosomal protein L10 [Clostridia bacterium]|mgnify:CR=1 FL=1|nr:50S ribosomal protein L10 [Clostridia bacterium]